MIATHYTDIWPKVAIRTACCIVAAVISLLGCTEDHSRTSNTAATPTPAATETPGFLESIKRSLGDATSEVQQAVSPRANELQSMTKEEVKKLYQWEYLVETVAGATESSELQSRLSALGVERWECFSITPAEDKLRITCKRRPYSTLSYFKCLSGF